MKSYFDAGSLIVIITTFVLFAVALFTKGFTHDLLLEAGVLLVSIKLIQMGYKSSLNIKSVENELKAIKGLLEQNQ
ncbi:MAG: hypothetical protein JSW04_09620 [Desulfobacterales bacterium]|nr:MAG: hypothetical protein JSV38_08295 [Desulfobacterales bacterium]UCD88716.1 MAG: hypothetical protein JSW04_09620 [Desulfobacterales bacterium]